MKRVTEETDDILKKQRRSNYTGFSEYMNSKENKLRVQFDSSKQIQSEIFKGICIHVNGLTKPPLSVLRFLILEHGGAFEQYYHRDRVTHFICTHVARAKLENFIKRSNGKIKVMKPEWIIDSIKAGKLLDEFDYRNYLNYDQKHNNLHKFFEKKDADADEYEIDQNEFEEENVEFHDPEALNFYKSDHSDSESESEFDSNDIDLLAGMIESSSEDEKEPIQSSIQTSPRAKTSANPEFLHEYYKNSRLHHLSTWREELKTYAVSLMKKRTKNPNSNNNNIHRERIIMHVDLDCFFVSVSLLKHPERETLKGKPIAVTHAKNENLNISESSADISSCNYEARAFGIRNDMYIRQALKLCPGLKMIPYDFEGYNKASRKFYEILAEWADELQAVSCDEAFIDLSGCELEPEIAAQAIRDEIKLKCEIDASIGIGLNLLIARLATMRAKPNGQFRVKVEEVDQFMAIQRLEDLPGVGNGLIEKLPKNIKTCADVLEIPLNELQSRLGHGQGLNLFRKARGEDDRTVGMQSDRKSVGSEVSWGVRFASIGQCKRFLEELGGEVWERMIEAFPAVPEPKPKRLQIKLYRKQEGAGQAKKHLGRGICDTFHRSKTFSKGLTKESVFIAEIWDLFEAEFLKGLATAAEDIRGIGIFLTEFTCNMKSDNKDISRLLLATGQPKQNNSNSVDALITASQIDSEAWAELPEEIRKEFEEEWKRRKQIKFESTFNGLKKPQKPPNQQMKPPLKLNRPSTTLTQIWGHREQRESAQLLLEISELPADQFDQQVVLALPQELQREIVEEWKAEKRRLEIKPCDSNLVKIEKKKSIKIDPEKVLKIVESLPIEFQGRKDWKNEQIHAFILKRKSTNDQKIIKEIEFLLIDLILFNCLKPVADSLAILRDNSNFDEILEKVQKLVADLYDGSTLKF
jgi:DNA repair protein REV1